MKNTSEKIGIDDPVVIEGCHQLDEVFFKILSILYQLRSSSPDTYTLIVITLLHTTIQMVRGDLSDTAIKDLVKTILIREGANVHELPLD